METIQHYLDYNATAPALPQVLEIIQELHSLPLNPSSVHTGGRKAKQVLDSARRTLAEVIGAFPAEIIFTSSGTEANNWAIRSFPGDVVLVSSIEHSSVLKTAQQRNHILLPVTEEGAVDMEKLKYTLKDKKNFLVSVMLANNETGVIQPIQEIAALVHEAGGLLHCDAVQALGKIPVDFTNLGCDMMTLSAHKMGGTLGAAALVVKNGLPLQPFITGGGQEQNRRAGTENAAAIAGFAKAAELIDFKHMAQIRHWLDNFEAQVTSIGGRVIGKEAPRLPNTSCIVMPNVTAETQLISFDLEGIAASAGSACSSGRIEPSHVLKAMGMETAQATSALRISGGWATTEQDINVLTAAWEKLFRRKHAL
ncbi:MAG TPA: cysteine desulfurase family protein [Rickettsiales bacterium]|nr:cysteine desulfurase family protein [Rickettsiales bacterium]